MNRKTKLFFYLVLITGFGLIALEVIKGKEPFELPLAVVILIILSIYAEFRSIASEEEYAISLSAPIAIFTTVLFPLKVIYLIMLLNAISVKIIAKQYNQNIKFLDEKFFFNFAQFIILASVLKYFSLNLPLTITPYSIGFMIIVPVLYLMGNYGFVYMIISLASNKNAFREINFLNMLWYFYYAVIMVQFMYYGYLAYGAIAVVMMFLFSEPVKVMINQKVNEIDLFRLKYHDGLTGAFNHTKMLDDIEKLTKGRQGFTLFFMDFDAFKKINDTYGHEAGNEVLKHFVGLLTHTFPDLNLYRYGGDEFCLVSKSTGQTEEIANQLSTISKLLSVCYEDKLITYAFSMGYQTFKADVSLSTSEIIKLVDQKMYKNKSDKYASESTWHKISSGHEPVHTN